MKSHQDRVSTRQAATILDTSERCLIRLRSLGRGPAWERDERGRISYARQEILAFGATWNRTPVRHVKRAAA